MRQRVSDTTTQSGIPGMSNLMRLLTGLAPLALVLACSETLAPTSNGFRPSFVIDPRCCPANAGSGCGCPQGTVGNSAGNGDTAGVSLFMSRSLITPTDLPAYGIPDLFGSPWPSQVTLFVAVDSQGSHLFGRTVTVAVETVDSLGASIDSFYSHVHTGAAGFAKPSGSISQATVNTGPDGLATVTYTSSGVSGPIILTGMSAGADSVADTLTVGVPGLTQLGSGGHYTPVGETTIHPSSHWVRPEVVVPLAALADSFFAHFGRGLEYNDASLPLGGKFDLHRQWNQDDPQCVFQPQNAPPRPNPRGCHQLHRVGMDVDLRTRVGTQPFTGEELRLIRVVWNLLTGDRAGTEADHYHLNFR